MSYYFVELLYKIFQISYPHTIQPFQNLDAKPDVPSGIIVWSIEIDSYHILYLLNASLIIYRTSYNVSSKNSFYLEMRKKRIWQRFYSENVNRNFLIIDAYLQKGNKTYLCVKGLPMRSWISEKTKGYISFSIIMSMATANIFSIHNMPSLIT